MNVMYLCNDGYADIAGISILSLLDNNQMMDEINIFLVEDAISKENKEKLQEIVNNFNRIIVFIPKPNIKRLLGQSVELHWWIENVFSRVFLEEVFKDYQDVDKLLYIDCDTLIVGSLKDLWELKLGTYVGAGVCEAMGNLHKHAIGLKQDDKYFNAGVFLIDVNKWRERKLDLAAREFVTKVNGRMEYADESVLNGILSKDMMQLSPKYNMTSLLFYFSSNEVKKYRKSKINYSEEERQCALNDPRIIHFTSTYLDVRPWVEGCNHPYVERWRNYKEKSPWSNERIKEDTRSKKKKIARNK